MPGLDCPRQQIDGLGELSLETTDPPGPEVHDTQDRQPPHRDRRGNRNQEPQAECVDKEEARRSANGHSEDYGSGPFLDIRLLQEPLDRCPEPEPRQEALQKADATERPISEDGEGLIPRETLVNIRCGLAHHQPFDGAAPTAQKTGTQDQSQQGSAAEDQQGQREHRLSPAPADRVRVGNVVEHVRREHDA